jgi:hypothetical protein
LETGRFSNFHVWYHIKKEDYHLYNTACVTRFTFWISRVTGTVILPTSWFASDFCTDNRQTFQFSSFHYQQFIRTSQSVHLSACYKPLQTSHFAYVEKPRTGSPQCFLLPGGGRRTDRATSALPAASLTQLPAHLFSRCDTAVSVPVVTNITGLFLVSY